MLKYRSAPKAGAKTNNVISCFSVGADFKDNRLDVAQEREDIKMLNCRCRWDGVPIQWMFLF